MKKYEKKLRRQRRAIDQGKENLEIINKELNRVFEAYEEFYKPQSAEVPFDLWDRLTSNAVTTP